MGYAAAVEANCQQAMRGPVTLVRGDESLRRILIIEDNNDGRAMLKIWMATRCRLVCGPRKANTDRG
jgi:hypothetical protein